MAAVTPRPADETDYTALVGPDRPPTDWHVVMRAYAFLAAAVALETGGTVCLKLVPRHFGWQVLAYALYAAAFALFPRVLERLALGVAYAVWSGVGSVLTAGIGYVYFHEVLTVRQLASGVLIVVGTVGICM